MPAGKIESYSSPAGQAIDEHDELARQIGELVELALASRRPRRFCFHRCLASSPLRARTTLLASAHQLQNSHRRGAIRNAPEVVGHPAPMRRQNGGEALAGEKGARRSPTIGMLLLLLMMMMTMTTTASASICRSPPPAAAARR
jgi:hypothetical protein